MNTLNSSRVCFKGFPLPCLSKMTLTALNHRRTRCPSLPLYYWEGIKWGIRYQMRWIRVYWLLCKDFCSLWNICLSNNQHYPTWKISIPLHGKQLRTRKFKGPPTSPNDVMMSMKYTHFMHTWPSQDLTYI